MKVSSQLAARGALQAAAANLGALALTAAVALSPPTALPAFAEAKPRVIGEIQGSGLVFKDTLRVEAFDDPKVEGVQLYLSDFQRPVTEKLAKGDIFSDPSQGGLTCSHKGKVVVTKAASTSLDGEEVFSESRSLLFKSLKVRRLVDREGESVVYVRLQAVEPPCAPVTMLAIVPLTPQGPSLAPQAVYSQRLDKNEDANNSRFKSNLCAIHADAFE